MASINISLPEGSGDNKAYVLAVTPPNTGTPTYAGSTVETFSGGGSITFVPNEPQWTYPISSQHLMASRIMQRIEAIDPTVFSWLADVNNLDRVKELYFILHEENSITTRRFVRTKINAAIIEKKIDDTQLDPCTKAVLEKLKNLKQNDIASMFEKFGVPVNGTYTLKIVIGTPDKPVALADTRQVSKNNYLITIRETYLKGTDNNLRPPTDLAIAAIVIHEIIHAHFFALFDDFRNNGNVCAYDNYDCLFMKYVTDNFEGTTDPHHSQMFENYLDVMANALQEFQTGIPVPNTEKAALFYHDLALSTMAGTRIFEDRYPLGYNSPTYEERKRITYNREAEDDNKIIDDGENGKYIPLSLIHI